MVTRDAVKRKATQARYRERNRLAIRARRQRQYAADAENRRAKQREYRRGESRPLVLAYNRKWSAVYRAQLRSEAIEAYGGRCACCGEKERAFLQLDHKENDGHLDRKVHRTSTKLLAVLKRAGWPRDRYQLLCANCNFGKLMNGGICPHKQK